MSGGGGLLRASASEVLVLRPAAQKSRAGPRPLLTRRARKPIQPNARTYFPASSTNFTHSGNRSSKSAGIECVVTSG